MIVQHSTGMLGIVLRVEPTRYYVQWGAFRSYVTHDRVREL